MWTVATLVYCACLSGIVVDTLITSPDNKGREFVLLFIENQKVDGQVFPLELYCTTQEKKVVNVHVISPKWTHPKVDDTFTVTDGQVHKTLVDPGLQNTGSSISSKSILIKADAEIACYGANKQTLSNDVYLALPVDALGTDYYAMAYSPATVKTELAIASTDDSTHVRVTLPTRQGNVDVLLKGKIYHAGDVISITLQKYDTIQLQSAGDLSGAHVETNKPVAVFSGNVKTSIGKGVFQDHLVEQLLSSNRWGEKFVTASMPGRTVGDVFKVVAREDNTVIDVHGKESINLNKGDVAKFELSSGHFSYITSTRPVMIAQFVKSQQNSSEATDPSMMIITPNEQFSSNCTFSTLEYSHPEYGNYPIFRYKNDFMIITKKSDIPGFLLDGKPFPMTTWTDIQGTDLAGSYVTLSHGTHTVRHSNPLSTFGGYLYGHAYHESYGFPTGMNTAIIYNNCTSTASVPGNGIDNNCTRNDSVPGQARNVTMQVTNVTPTQITKVTTLPLIAKPTTKLTSNPSTAIITTTHPTTKVTTPSTTLAVSTGPPPKTLPPVTTTCAVCAGPKFLCEKLYAPMQCLPPNNYCINTIRNHKDGTKTVNRACGSFNTCYREWFLGSSDNDKCRKFNGNDEQNLDFQCTFCCIKDNCNNPLHPADDTLYKPL